jgi:hypothetical protein
MADFRKGINITELDKERSEKAEFINEKMKEATNNRKSGKAHTGRVAIDGCYKLLKMLEEEEEEKNSEMRKILDFEDKLLNQEL